MIFTLHDFIAGVVILGAVIFVGFGLTRIDRYLAVRRAIRRRLGDPRWSKGSPSP